MHTYTPHGVCSRAISVELDGDRVSHVEFAGGCDGNLKGIRNLLKGMKAEEAIARMKGVKCGSKGTSCPEQIAFALEEALAAQK